MRGTLKRLAGDAGPGSRAFTWTHNLVSLRRSRGHGGVLGKFEIAGQKWEDGRPKATWMATVTQATGR